MRALLERTDLLCLAIPGLTGQEKNDFPIELQETLRVPVFANQTTDVQWEAYLLRAAILHYGQESTSGHYRALVSHEGDWYLADDSKTPEKCALADPIVCRNCYVLFLERHREAGDQLTAPLGSRDVASSILQQAHGREPGAEAR